MSDVLTARAAGAGQGLSVIVPEIDPIDIAQIEVLRGPQGTLYGANSLGGLLKYVTVNPSMDRVSGRMRAGITGVQNSDELGYSISGAVNVPLNDAWAVRASAYTRRDPGYIDDPAHGREAVNWGETSGGRFAALWAPSEDFSLKFGALLQDGEAHGSTLVTRLPGAGDLQQNNLPQSGGYHRELQLYSLSLSAKLGEIGLTAISAYVDNEGTFFNDLNAGGGAGGLGAIANNFYGVTGVQSIQSAFSTKFTEEVRLVVPIGSRIEWLFGAFYANDDKLVPSDVNEKLCYRRLCRRPRGFPGADLI